MKRANKTIATLACVVMLITAMMVFAISSGAAATTNTDAGVTLPGIDSPFKTFEELGIDMTAIKAKFPERVEMKYEDGKILVPDIGADTATLYGNNAVNYKLELIDGYWTAEVEEDISTSSNLIMNFDYPYYKHNISWSVSYDNCSLFYVNIYNNVDDVAVKFKDKFKTVTVEYENGDNFYEDTYKNGSLSAHCVSSLAEKKAVVANYDSDGNLKYCKVKDTYYIPDKGWSRFDTIYFQCNPPAGYEDKDIDEILGNKLSLICNHNDYTNATCTSPSICNVCGNTKGDPIAHKWGHLTGVCTVCGVRVIPEFTYPNTSYATLEDVGFDYAKVTAAFREKLEIKYENGKYMIKDIGASKAEVAPGPYFERAAMTLVDGWWVASMDAATYSGQDICVHFSGDSWTFQYQNGERTGFLYIISADYYNTVTVYFDTETVVFSYELLDRRYRDSYLNGYLNAQEVIVRVNGVTVHTNYDGNGNFVSASVTDGKVSYYDAENGWWQYGSGGSKIACDPPAGYASIDSLVAVTPTIINCSHEQYFASGCNDILKCIVCDRAKEGNATLGHDIVVDKAKEPTCTKSGLTEGSHCSRCDEMTIAQTYVRALGHDIVIDKAKEPTCTKSGLTEGSHCSRCDGATVAQEEILALGHSYDNACDATCNTCAEERIPADHIDEDENNTCEICGSKISEDVLSGGAIAGIVAGSTVTAGVGGFSLFWFVIKKRKWSDLVTIFKK